jgi:hypothetical protein
VVTQATRREATMTCGKASRRAVTPGPGTPRIVRASRAGPLPAIPTMTTTRSVSGRGSARQFRPGPNRAAPPMLPCVFRSATERRA